MNPLLGYQLERQIIVLDEQQQQGCRREEPTKDSVTAHEQPSSISAQIPSSESSLGAHKRRKKANQLNDGLALQMAHPKLLHPAPVVAMKYSPILEAIDKLETLSLTMDPTSVTMVQSDEDKRPNFPTPESHGPLEIGHSPKVNSLPPTTAPSAIILYESDSTHQHSGLATSSSSTPIESAAAVVAHPSRATVNPRLPSICAASTASTSYLFPRSATSSTRSRYSIPDTYTSIPVVSSRLRTSSSANTMDNVSIGWSDNRVCEQVGNEHVPMAHADERHQEHQDVSKTRDDGPNSRESVGAEMDSNIFPAIHSTSIVSLSAESSPHNKTSRPPMAPRALSFFKKKPSLYTHQSMAQSDSHIDHPAPYSMTDMSSNNKRQSSSVLASISSTFLGIRGSSRSRSHSNTSSVSLATIRSSAAVNDSFAIKRHSQTAQITCVLPPPMSTTPVSNDSANLPNVRPFNIFNTGHQHPMSTPSHSHSTPTLLSCNKANHAKETSVIRRAGCTCRNTQFPGPCLFHKKLPSIPVAQVDDKDPTGSAKEKKKSNSISIMSPAVSIRSFVASMKKSRSRPTSVQSLAEINTPSARESQLRSQSNTSLPYMHPQEPTLNHGSLLSTTRHMNGMGPLSIVHGAKKWHTAADAPLTESSESSMDQLDFQQVKRQAIYGLKERPLFPSYHGSEQSRPCADRLYLCPISDSIPCFSPPSPFTKATTSDKGMIQRMPAITRIRQAAESAPNLSLHGGAHVSAVNAQAEIIVRPHIAEASTTSRRGGLNFITNSTPDLPSIARSRSLLAPVPSVHSPETYNKENATFFEPFQAYSHGHGGQASRYVSFHFDLSHLERTENDAENDLTLASKDDVDHPEQATVEEGEESEDGGDEYEVVNVRRVSSSPPAHPSMLQPIVTLSTTGLLPVHLRHRATLPPSPPPPRSIPHEKDQEGCSSNGDEDPFQTLRQHFRTSNRFAPTATSTLASASNPSLYLPSQPQSDQQSAFKRFFGYGKNGSKHRGHHENRPGVQGATNSSTVSLPAMLSSFLPPSASTTSLPLHSNRTHLSTEPRLTDRGSRLPGSKWNWMWWKNGNKASKAGIDGVGGQESHQPKM